MTTATPRTILADPEYGFCHDKQYPLTVDEAEWCPLLPVDDPPCPAFAFACDAPRAMLHGEPGPGSVREAGKDAPPQRGETQQPRSTPSDKPPPAESNPMAHVFMWIIVGAMLVALVLQMRAQPSVGRRDDDPTPKPRAPDEPETQDESEGPLDAEGMLARATALAARGELARAISAGHRALLRRLAERGHIRLHSSRTNGDHLRDLRAAPELHAPAREVVAVAERVQFGHASVPAVEVERLLAIVRSVMGSALSLVLVVWTSLGCMSHAARDYPWSHSPTGTAGVLAHVRANDMTIAYRTSALAELRTDGPIPIVLPNADLTDDETEALLEYVQDGGTAALIGNPDLPSAFEITKATRKPGPLLSSRSELRLVVPGNAGLLAHGDETWPAWDGIDGVAYAVYVEYGAGLVLVVADGRLFTNASLAVADDAAVLVDLLRPLGSAFEVIDGGVRSAGGAGAENPFEAVERAGLTAVIVQLLLFVLVLYAWRGAHFGRPRDPPPPSRRRFAMHVDALAQHYFRAGARRHSLRLYAAWALERIQARFDARRRGLHALAGRIAARTGGDETEIMRILVEAHHARDDAHDTQGTDEDLRTLRELGRLIDTTRGPK